MPIPWLGGYAGPTVSIKRAYELTLGKMEQPKPTEGDIEVEYLNSGCVSWNDVEPNPDRTMWASPTEVRHLAIKPGDLLISEGGDVGRCAIYNGEPGRIFQKSLHRVRSWCGSDVRYLKYVMHALHGSGWLDILCNKATMAHFTAEKLGALDIPYIPIEEQRRIADFLDAETARIDTIVMTRQQQMRLQAQRFAQVINAAVVGDLDALAAIGYTGNAGDWSTGKVSRLFTIIPGFAFASEKFIAGGIGTRLLRGINVIPGQIDWTVETVAWDLESSPIDQRFHLRLDDLVVGMDRPWISTGTRVALIRENDLPSLLLQRVACIRPRTTSTTRYLRWVLTSSHFQFALESETTGVSVPHISGEQIGAFTYRLPPPDEQRVLAHLLEAQHQVQVSQKELVDRQLAVLAERRQALITAAVTGGITI